MESIQQILRGEFTRELNIEEMTKKDFSDEPDLNFIFFSRLQLEIILQRNDISGLQESVIIEAKNRGLWGIYSAFSFFWNFFKKRIAYPPLPINFIGRLSSDSINKSVVEHVACFKKSNFLIWSYNSHENDFFIELCKESVQPSGSEFSKCWDNYIFNKIKATLEDTAMIETDEYLMSNIKLFIEIVYMHFSKIRDNETPDQVFDSMTYSDDTNTILAFRYRVILQLFIERIAPDSFWLNGETIDFKDNYSLLDSDDDHIPSEIRIFDFGQTQKEAKLSKKSSTSRSFQEKRPSLGVRRKNHTKSLQNCVKKV